MEYLSKQGISYFWSKIKAYVDSKASSSSSGNELVELGTANANKSDYKGSISLGIDNYLSYREILIELDGSSMSLEGGRPIRLLTGKHMLGTTEWHMLKFWDELDMVTLIVAAKVDVSSDGTITVDMGDGFQGTMNGIYGTCLQISSFMDYPINYKTDAYGWAYKFIGVK